jgi:hypothetical protein
MYEYTFCQPSIEYFGPTSGIESSNGSPLVYLSYDDGDDSDDLMIIGEEVNKSNNKGKTIEAIHQEVSDHTFYQPAEKSIGSVSGIEYSNCYSLVSHNLIDVYCHDLSIK